MAGLSVAIAARRVEGLSGTTTTIIEHSRRLAALGCRVQVFGERLDRGRIRAAGAETRWIPGWPWGSAFKRRFFAVICDRVLAGRGFDLVHGHGDNFAQDVLSLHNCVHAAHEAVRGEPLPAASGVGRVHERILREGRFRLLIANSGLMRDEVRGRFGVPAEKIEVIYPGYDPGRFQPADRDILRGPARAELGVGGEEALFGLITSGDFVKRGVDTFLAAMRRVLRAGVKARALVIGKEARLAPYLRRAEAEGVAQATRFLSPTADIARWFHALDVYVHPARYEEFGQSVQEALACGVAVVAGRRVGAAELMRGEARDFLLERGDAEELAGKLVRLAREPERRARLAAQGPAAVAGNTWDANFRATLACYQRLVPRFQELQ
ncbi:MAG: glycosyltransferase family 4 protein [Elusimicrobia bacterium]|nr:glycosyltransferase family 4 protein [Elusimicrobiota bacterium]